MPPWHGPVRTGPRGRDFRRLWIAFGVSTAGTHISLVAFSLYLLDDFGAWAVGTCMATVALARLALLPWGGVLADRRSRTGLVAVQGYGLSPWAPR